MMRFDNIVSLPSGNTARGFNVRDLGNGRMQVSYIYTDRRRANQVSRHFTAEFLNGHLQSIVARSARGGRVEFFSTSLIIDVLLEMLAEVNRANEASRISARTPSVLLKPRSRSKPTNRTTLV